MTAQDEQSTITGIVSERHIFITAWGGKVIHIMHTDTDRTLCNRYMPSHSELFGLAHGQKLCARCGPAELFEELDAYQRMKVAERAAKLEAARLSAQERGLAIRQEFEEQVLPELERVLREAGYTTSVTRASYDNNAFNGLTISRRSGVDSKFTFRFSVDWKDYFVPLGNGAYLNARSVVREGEGLRYGRE